MPTTKMPPAQRSLIASIAANTRWASVNSPEARSAATAAARAGRRRAWERRADPDGVLPPAELAAAVERLKTAHFRLMALRSAQARSSRRAA